MQENFRYIVGGKEVTRDEFFNIAGDWVTTVSGWDVSKQPFSNYFDGEKNKTAGLSTRHKAGKTMTYLDEAIEQEENLKIVGDLEGINKPPQAKVSPHFLDEVLEQTNSAEKETKTKNFPEYTTTTITLETNPEQREKINEIIEEFNKNSAKENKTEENLVFPKDSEIHKEELPPYEPLDFSLLLTDWVDTLTGKFDRPNSFSIRPEGVKETNGKVDYSEINLGILDLMAERFTANKHKYPKGNMKKPIDVKSLEWALFRHVKKMIQPIEEDEETYKDHLSAVLCNASMILDQLKNNPK